MDTYLVCGEKGRALDLRDVYDVAVNPEVIYAVNADPSGDLLTKVGGWRWCCLYRLLCPDVHVGVWWRELSA